MSQTAWSTDSMSLTFNSYLSAAYIDLHLKNHSFANMPKRDNTGIQRPNKLKTGLGCIHLTCGESTCQCKCSTILKTRS